MNHTQQAIQKFYEHLKKVNLLKENNPKLLEDILSIHLGYGKRTNNRGITVENVRFLILNLILKLDDIPSQRLQYQDGLGISDRDCIVILQESDINQELAITEIAELFIKEGKISLIEDRLLWNRIADYLKLDAKDAFYFEYRKEADLKKVFAPYADPLEDGRKIIILDSTDDLPIRIYCEPIIKNK